MTDTHPRHRIRCELDGKTYEGTYWVAGKLLVVSTAKGGASARLGLKYPEAVAAHLLTNLAADGKV